MELTLHPPAKLNLCLDILNKRDDGFHNLKSIFYETKLCDELSVLEMKENTDQEIVNGPFADELIGGGTNLCLKAIELIRGIYPDWNNGIHYQLTKCIPTQAGIGGGSSDAVGMLKACQTLLSQTESGITEQLLYELSLKLGSDCPFFLKGDGALVQGRGGKLEHFEIKRRLNLMIIVPHDRVSTGEAFGSLDPSDFSEKSDTHQLQDYLSGKEVQLEEIFLQNTFQKSVSKYFPGVAMALAELDQLGATHSLMSGSGSACFGIFTSEEAVNRAQKFAAEVHSEYRLVHWESAG